RWQPRRLSRPTDRFTKRHTGCRQTPALGFDMPPAQPHQATQHSASPVSQFMDQHLPNVANAAQCCGELTIVLYDCTTCSRQTHNHYSSPSDDIAESFASTIVWTSATSLSTTPLGQFRATPNRSSMISFTACASST